jgi:hypothetical protein
LPEKRIRVPWQLKRLYDANLKICYETEAALELFNGLLNYIYRTDKELSRQIGQADKQLWITIENFEMEFNIAMDQVHLATDRRREAIRSAYYHEKQWENAVARGDAYAAAWHAQMKDYYERLAYANGREIQKMFAKAISVARTFDLWAKPAMLQLVRTIPPWADEKIRELTRYFEQSLGVIPHEYEHLLHEDPKNLQEAAKTDSGQDYDKQRIEQINQLEQRFQELCDAQIRVQESIQEQKEKIQQLVALQGIQISIKDFAGAAKSAELINQAQQELDQLYQNLSYLQEETAKVMQELEELRR